MKDEEKIFFRSLMANCLLTEDVREEIDGTVLKKVMIAISNKGKDLNLCKIGNLTLAGTNTLRTATEKTIRVKLKFKSSGSASFGEDATQRFGESLTETALRSCLKGVVTSGESYADIFRLISHLDEKDLDCEGLCITNGGVVGLFSEIATSIQKRESLSAEIMVFLDEMTRDLKSQHLLPEKFSLESVTFNEKDRVEIEVADHESGACFSREIGEESSSLNELGKEMIRVISSQLLDIRAIKKTSLRSAAEKVLMEQVSNQGKVGIKKRL